MATTDIPAAGYRYVPYAFQYSGGVEALPGHQIERVEFSKPLPLAPGFDWIERYHGLLRMRAAVARAVHRTGFH